MKLTAAFLILVWGSLLVQPAFAYFGGKAAYGDCSKVVTSEQGCSKSKPAGSSCSKKKDVSKSCSKEKGSKPKKSPGKNNCESGGCNPTLGCTSGNFYIHYHAQILLPLWFAQKQKAIVFDDNRIVKNMSECWHPPEA